MLNAKISLDELDYGAITNLYIMHDYDRELPDLSIFPNLISFSSSLPVDMAYLEKQDLSRIKKLRLLFNIGAGEIRINAPALEVFAVNILNNDYLQLDIFTCYDNSIVLSGKPMLKQLEFRHCSGHEVLFDGDFPFVEKVVFCEQGNTDFGMLAAFPNLKELSIIRCGCHDVEFARELKNLVKLDVSYNYISDIAPLLDLPLLEEVNLFHNNEVTNACLLKEKGCKVLVTNADKSFESFKSSLRTVVITTYAYVEHGRKPDPKRNSVVQHFIDRRTDECIFLWSFTNAVKRKIDYFSTSASMQCQFPIPYELLVDYVRTEYSFVEI